MAGNQQFCLRWNNHQSTLISVFDNLLESGTLVDCTLAAEGQYLKAHKVVLSACSPFFEGLFSQHYEKHPIIILKDVTFAELKAMLDYMYRGEVNISQDQLGTFLKAAESLQIKGLTDSSGNGDLYRKPPPEPRRIIMPPLSKSPSYPATATALLQAGIQNMQTLSTGLVVEPRPPSVKMTNNNVDSPPRRKRRLSEESLPDVPASALVQPQCNVSEPPDDYLKSTNQVKSEKSDSVNNDESGDDTAPYPEEEEEEEMDLSKPGTSSTPNSHPPGAWNANSAENTSDEPFPPGGSQEQDNRWMVVTRPLVQSLKAPTTAAQSSSTIGNPGCSGAGRGGTTPNRSISCPTCHKFYSSQHTLRRHIRLECGKEPQFHCPYCPRKTKQRYNLMLHIARAHKPEQMTPLW